MAVVIVEDWSAYALDNLKDKDPALQNPEAPELLATGLVGLVDAQFPERGTKWHVPGLKDLSSTLGGDQRIRKGVDMTLKGLDGWYFEGPIMHRGDAFYDEYIQKAQTNLDLLNAYGPQVVGYNEEQISESVIAAVHGAFAPGGALAATHSYGDGSAPLTSGMLAKAGPKVFGKYSSKLKMIVVNSAVYGEAKNAGSVTLFNATTAGVSIMTMGTLPMMDGKRIIINDDLATNVTFDITAATTDVVTTKHNGSAVTHGFSNDDVVRFELTSDGGSDALPAGLSADTDYYIINASTNTFKVSLTEGGSAVDITGTGTGTFRVVHQSHYYSYVAAPVACYLGYQKLLDVRQGRHELKGGGTDYLKWTVSYGAGVYGCSYVDSSLASDEKTEGPDRASLALASTWSKAWDNDRIRIMRIRHSLS